MILFIRQSDANSTAPNTTSPMPISLKRPLTSFINRKIPTQDKTPRHKLWPRLIDNSVTRHEPIGPFSPDPVTSRREEGPERGWGGGAKKEGRQRREEGRESHCELRGDRRKDNAISDLYAIFVLSLSLGTRAFAQHTWRTPTRPCACTCTSPAR